MLPPATPSLVIISPFQPDALVAANAVAQGATDGGALAVAEAYHTILVAPFCFAAVKTFFANP